MSEEMYFIVKGQIRREKELCENMGRLLSHAWRAGIINERSFETDGNSNSRLIFKHLATRNIEAASDHLSNSRITGNMHQLYHPRKAAPLRYFPHRNPDRAHSCWVANDLEDNSEGRLSIGIAGMLLLESAGKHELAGAYAAPLVTNGFGSPVFKAGCDLFERCVFLDQDAELRILARDTIFEYWTDYVESQSPSTNERWWVFRSDPATGGFLAWTRTEHKNRISPYGYIFPPSPSDAHYLVCRSKESHDAHASHPPLLQIGKHEDSRQACDAMIKALLPQLSPSKKSGPRAL